MKHYKMKLHKKINNQNNINSNLIFNKSNYKKSLPKIMNSNQNNKLKIWKKQQINNKKNCKLMIKSFNNSKT